MYKRRYYVVLDLEVCEGATVTREDAAEALRDIVNIPQMTNGKETYWVETATVFDDLLDLRTANEKELI